MITPDRRKVLDGWIDTITAVGRNLTEWEIEFVDSVGQQLDDTGTLSPKQEAILERIYAEKTPC